MTRRFVLLTAALVALAPNALAQGPRTFTFQEALGFGTRLTPETPLKVSWLDAQTYTVEQNGKIFSYDARTGEQRPNRSLATPDEQRNTPNARRRGGGIPGGGNGNLTDPSGRRTASVKQNDLYVTEKGTNLEKRITTDGSATILNGILDWVYDEEIYGRGSRWGYRWSPDGRYLAYLRLDEAPVKPITLTDHLPQAQALEPWFYPKAGMANPLVTLWVVDVTAQTPKPVQVPLDAYVPEDRLVVRFAFTPDSKKLLYQVQNKEQTFLDVITADAANPKEPKRLFRESSNSGWIDVTDYPMWLKDGTFLWTSDRSGYRHIYRYKLDGTLAATVTEGMWDARRVTFVDEEAGTIYVESNVEQVSGSDFMRARLDGKGRPVRLTSGPGTHVANFAPGRKFFIDTVSTAETPGEIRVCDDEGKVLRVLGKVSAPAAAKEYSLGIPKYVQVKARDGYVLEGTLLLPPTWKPGMRVPVYCPVYAGPDAPTARNAWSSVNGQVLHQYLAQQGIAVWMCDNRTANPRGYAARTACWRQFGVSELRDIEDGLKALDTLGYADPKRVAIEGWSFGGFMSAYALTHSDMFKVGIAGAGVMDWQLYDTIYTERYMGTPQKNAAGYKAGSVVAGAAKLNGNLLIVHGMMDDNVHVQNSMQLVYALQKAGKKFDMMLYPSPSSRHGIGDPDLSKHNRELRLKYLVEKL